MECESKAINVSSRFKAVAGLSTGLAAAVMCIVVCFVLTTSWLIVIGVSDIALIAIAGGMAISRKGIAGLRALYAGFSLLIIGPYFLHLLLFSEASFFSSLTELFNLSVISNGGNTALYVIGACILAIFPVILDLWGKYKFENAVSLGRVLTSSVYASLLAGLLIASCSYSFENFSRDVELQHSCCVGPANPFAR